MIQKIKSWIANKPQFEFIPGTMGYQVIRLSDGIVFRVNHPYIYDDGKIPVDGTNILFFYILFFSSIRRIHLQFELSKGGVVSKFGNRMCEINDLIYKKDGSLETIGLK